MNDTLCCDFDGVIHKGSRGHMDGTIYDVPTENCAFTIKNLLKRYKIVIFTSRNVEDYPKIREWLKANDIPDLPITNVKPQNALAFIDDRAIRFTSWADIVHYFL